MNVPRSVSVSALMLGFPTISRTAAMLSELLQPAPEPGVDGNRGQEGSSNIPPSLFDLDADPGETTDLAAQYPDLVLQLTEAATAFDADIKSNVRPIGQR